MTLTELANKYGTDKGTVTEPRHGYTEVYERYLSPVRERLERVLEIGIQTGASLRMWRDYFPNAEVVGVDISEAWVVGVQEEARIEGVLGDVRDQSFWRIFGERYKDGFNLVVDDGGHLSEQIIDAFYHAWPLVRPGGLYLIEDLHQGYAIECSDYGGAGPKVFTYLQGLMHLELNEWGKEQTGRRLEGQMEFVHYYKSLAIIKKRSLTEGNKENEA